MIHGVEAVREDLLVLVRRGRGGRVVSEGLRNRSNKVVALEKIATEPSTLAAMYGHMHRIMVAEQ